MRGYHQNDVVQELNAVGMGVNSLLNSHIWRIQNGHFKEHCINFRKQSLYLPGNVRHIYSVCFVKSCVLHSGPL